jgi:hypothetical protein
MLINVATIVLILAAVVGVLMYALLPGKLSRIGEIVFFCAFLALMFVWGHAR